MGSPSLRTVLRAIALHAESAGKAPAEVARALVLGQFQSSVLNGRTVIRTSEAGGNTEFSLPEGLGPGEVMELGARALDWIEAQTDPTAPGLPRVSRRLRAAFDRARL